MSPVPDGPRLRSYLCPGWVLRITRRCVEEDLGRNPGEGFERLLSDPIVKAFSNKRRNKADDTKKIEPLSTGRTIYRLAHQHRYRGATWYDDAHNVIWLCASGRHESGAEGDAFPYFKRLDAEDRLLPTADDYEALFDDQTQRFADAVVVEAQDLLARARSDPGTEQRGVIGGIAGAGVVVEIIETLEETSVAVTVNALPPGWLDTLLAAFDPDLTYQDWELTDQFPTRQLYENEVCFRHLKES